MFGEFLFADSLFANSDADNEWKEECKNVSTWSEVSKSNIPTEFCEE